MELVVIDAYSLRLYFFSEESGKLECLAVVAYLGPHATLRCQVESVGTREEIPFWKSEPGIDAPPLADPTLASLGQRIIQVSSKATCPILVYSEDSTDHSPPFVLFFPFSFCFSTLLSIDVLVILKMTTVVQVEEPEALVDITLEAPSPGLVGEAFPVCITISSAGHSIQAGDLEVYFAPSGKSEAGLSSTSPTTKSEVTPADLLIRNSRDNPQGWENFEIFAGLVEVPEISTDGSWSTVIYVRWLEPKAITLMATFVYHASEEGGSKYQYRLHKSKEFDCVEALAIEHHYVAPFRRDALLLGNLDADTTGGQVPAITLALRESSILVVTLKNKSSLSVRLLEIRVIEEDTSRCIVQKSGAVVNKEENNDSEGEAGGILVAPQEIFTQLFCIHPLVPSKALFVGTISVLWQRALSSDFTINASEVTIQDRKYCVDSVNNRVPLAKIMVESPPLVVNLDCPPHAVLGKPFTMTTKVQNMTNTLQEVAFSVVDTASFIFSGAHSDTVSILPRGTHFLSYKLVPLASGIQQLPQVKINSAWYSAVFQPSPLSTQIFVFPSTRFDLGRHSSIDEAFSSLVIS